MLWRQATFPVLGGGLPPTFGLQARASIFGVAAGPPKAFRQFCAPVRWPRRCPASHLRSPAAGCAVRSVRSRPSQPAKPLAVLTAEWPSWPGIGRPLPVLAIAAHMLRRLRGAQHSPEPRRRPLWWAPSTQRGAGTGSPDLASVARPVSSSSVSRSAAVVAAFQRGDRKARTNPR
jgi:hypothetical protein